MILSKALGIQTVSQVSALALGCRAGLHGSLQGRIIHSLHFDSKSMCFEVIIGRAFSFLVLVFLGFFCCCFVF